MLFDQVEYEVRCEWGLAGLRVLGPVTDVAIIVDILSFSTAVDVAVARGAAIFPYPWKDESAPEFARSKGALLASKRSHAAGYSLAPASLATIPHDAALVLPSTNGSTLCRESRAATTFTACLRNCEAVARRVADFGATIAVIPAGEQWADGTLRPSLEDLAGAGAVLAGLRGRRSPEAELAVSVFERFRNDLAGVLSRCSSGKELIDRGFPSDIAMAVDYGTSAAVPLLRGGRFVNAALGV